MQFRKHQYFDLTSPDNLIHEKIEYMKTPLFKSKTYQGP